MDRQRLWSRRTVIGGLLATLASGCGQASTPPPSAPVIPAVPTESTTTVPVRRGDLVETIIVSAQLTTTNQVTLFFQQAGRLKNLFVSSNDRVKSGQVVAELDVGTLGTDVTLAELTMKKAQAKLEQARVKGLDRFEVQLLQLDYDAAMLTYERLRDQLEAATLVAPFDGLVTETQGRPGEAIAAFRPIVTIADPAELQVTALARDVSEGARLTIGQPATLVLDKLPNSKVPLEVVQLPTTSPTLVNGTPTPSDVARAFKLNPTQPLPQGVEIGMLGRATVVLREKKGVLLVKSTAVRSAGPRRYVQVVQSGRKRDVDVEIGIVTPVDTEIVVGLSDGDRVVDGPVGAPPPAGTPATKA
jgi:macrolide-specific efflux system membrane fusion protein